MDTDTEAFPEVPDSAKDSVLQFKIGLLFEFAEAVAKSHPEPEKLLSVFQSILADDEWTPPDGWTPDNQIAQKHYETWRDLLIRAISKRVEKP